MGSVDVSFSGRPGAVVVAVAWLEDGILPGDCVKLGCWFSSHTPEYLKKLSQREMARRTMISWARIDKCLTLMEDLGILTRTVENPGTPQSRVNVDFKIDVWTGGRASDARPPARETRATKVSQDLEEISTRDDLFETLWKTYPRKEAKKQARATWNKLSYANQLIAVESLPAWLKNRDPKFMPYLQRWLSAERWLDEPALISTPVVSRGVPPDRPPGVHPSAKWNGTKWVQPF